MEFSCGEAVFECFYEPGLDDVEVVTGGDGHFLREFGKGGGAGADDAKVFLGVEIGAIDGGQELCLFFWGAVFYGFGQEEEVGAVFFDDGYAEIFLGGEVVVDGGVLYVEIFCNQLIFKGVVAEALDVVAAEIDYFVSGCHIF